MPKPSQGVATAEGSLKIEVKDLIKRSCFNGLKKYEGVLSWKNEKGENTNSIRLQVNLSSEENYVSLYYSVISKSDNNQKGFEQRIYFEKVKSNLGNGDVYYFVCPLTQEKCRILYMAYGSNYFLSRNAYTNRIYYRCQTYSKNFYATERYFQLNAKYEKMIRSNYRKFYKGKKTRSLERIEKLEDDIKYFDRLRTLNMFNVVSKMKGF